MKKNRVTIKEASRVSGKSIQTVRNWIRAGKVDAVKKGKVWMIKADTLTATAGATARKRGRKKKVESRAAGKTRIEKATNETLESMKILEVRVSALEDRQTRIEEENERLRDRDENLRERIRKVFGPVLAPLVERLLEIG